ACLIDRGSRREDPQLPTWSMMPRASSGAAPRADSPSARWSAYQRRALHASIVGMKQKRAYRYRCYPTRPGKLVSWRGPLGCGQGCLQPGTALIDQLRLRRQCPDPSRAAILIIWCGATSGSTAMKGRLSLTAFIDLCRTISLVMLRTGACAEAAKTTKGYARPDVPPMKQESSRL